MRIPRILREYREQFIEFLFVKSICSIREQFVDSHHVHYLE